MVEKSLLKEMIFLEDLPDELLDQVSLVAKQKSFEPGAVLFHQGQELTHLYMLVSGVIHLTLKSPSGKFLTLDKVYPGRTFGISALMKDTTSSFAAVCAEECSAIVLSGEEMHKLFEQDFKLGHILMLRVVNLFKYRMEMHTRQFLLSLANHPAVSQL